MDIRNKNSVVYDCFIRRINKLFLMKLLSGADLTI